MKIMQIVSGTDVSGAVKHCLLLSRELVRRGHEVSLVCRPDAWIGEQVRSEPIELIHSDLRRWPADELRRIAAILDRGNYDVVNTHMSRASLFGVLLRLFTRVPRIATAHSRHFQPHWALNDMVIAASETTRQFHRRINLVPAQRIVTVHNFADHEVFDDLGPDVRRRTREELGVGQTDTMITVVGKVISGKGQIYAVRALARVLAAIPNARIVFVGKEVPPYSQHVRSEAEALGVSSHIHWLGLREDVPELLAASDLFLLPSLEETLSLAILEAMVAGLPTVATTVGGNAECVAQGETGLLVRPRDERALGEAIVALLANEEKCRRMGFAARCRFLDEFSTASQVRAIEAVFEQVANRRRLARAA